MNKFSKTIKELFNSQAFHTAAVTVSTVVMAIATVVMMNSGCQQTRMADAAESRNAIEQRSQMLRSKKELRRISLEYLALTSDGGTGSRRFETVDEWETFARQAVLLLSEGMDNVYLLAHPETGKELGASSQCILRLFAFQICNQFNNARIAPRPSNPPSA